MKKNDSTITPFLKNSASSFDELIMVFYLISFLLLYNLSTLGLLTPSPQNSLLPVNSQCFLFIGLARAFQEHGCKTLLLNQQNLKTFTNPALLHPFHFLQIIEAGEKSVQASQVFCFPLTKFRASNWVIDDLKAVQQQE